MTSASCDPVAESPAVLEVAPFSSATIGQTVPDGWTQLSLAMCHIKMAMPIRLDCVSPSSMTRIESAVRRR